MLVLVLSCTEKLPVTAVSLMASVAMPVKIEPLVDDIE